MQQDAQIMSAVTAAYRQAPPRRVQVEQQPDHVAFLDPAPPRPACVVAAVDQPAVAGVQHPAIARHPRHGSARRLPAHALANHAEQLAELAVRDDRAAHEVLALAQRHAAADGALVVVPVVRRHRACDEWELT